METNIVKMSDNIAAQPENMAKTKKLFMSVLVKPLNEKSLQRPPFKFIQELIKNVVSETRMLADLYTSQDLDTSQTLEKAAKIAFLQKLIVFLDNELGSYLKVDVNAAKIVAGLDPDKTNHMLQALAYVLISRKTGKSIHSLVQKQPRKDSTSTNRALIPKQPNASTAGQGDTKRGYASSTKVISAKEQSPKETNSASSDRRQTDSRPGSSRISSSNSGRNPIVSPNSRTSRKNSSASSTKASVSPTSEIKVSSQDSRRSSSNYGPNDPGSFVQSMANKLSAKSSTGIRPATSSKPPPRAVTKEELANADSTIGSGSTRPGTAANHNQIVNLSESRTNEDIQKLFGDTDSTTDRDSSSDDHRHPQRELATKSTVGGRINDFEEVINKKELVKLMKYQDSLKKFDINKGVNSLWNGQVPTLDDPMNKKSVQSGEPIGDGSPSSANQLQSGVIPGQQLDKHITEQTDKMKQGLKMLAQFIVPANKAVNFIFEDFDSIRTDFDKCVQMTDRDSELEELRSNKTANTNSSTLAMARLNDLEVNIEKTTEQLNRLKSQLVQNETRMRQKILSQVSMM